MQPPSDPALHPDVAALSFLLGTWRGTGEGQYPTVDPFGYGEEMTFTHVGDPFLAYEQRSWSLEDGAPLHFERGFLRGGEGIELVLAHPLGIVEVSTGKEVGPGIADEVGDEGNECAGNGDIGWFKLHKFC